MPCREIVFLFLSKFAAYTHLLFLLNRCISDCDLLATLNGAFLQRLNQCTD